MNANDITNYTIILMLIWVLLWFIYDHLLKLLINTKKDLFLTKIIKLPNDLKCLPFDTFLNNYCERNDIDVYSIIHFVIYVTVGFFVPNMYVVVFVFSVLFELYELLIGLRCRLWQDPLFNLMGYFIGSSIINYTKSKRLIDYRMKTLLLFDKVPLWISSIILIVVLCYGYIFKKYINPKSNLDHI